MVLSQDRAGETLHWYLHHLLRQRPVDLPDGHHGDSSVSHHALPHQTQGEASFSPLHPVFFILNRFVPLIQPFQDVCGSSCVTLCLVCIIHYLYSSMYVSNESENETTAMFSVYVGDYVLMFADHFEVF